MSSRQFFLIFGLILCGLTGCRNDSAETAPVAPESEPGNLFSEDSGSTVTAPPDAEELIATTLEKGFQSFSAGDLSQASKLANQALLRDPGNGRAMVLAGQVAIARGEVDDGIEILRAAADVWPEQSAALLAEAVGLLWQADRLEEAQAGFIMLLRKHPEYDAARRGLAELLNRRGFRFDANQQIRVLCGRPGVQATIDELRCLVVPSRAYQPFTEKPRVDDREWIESMGELNVARALYGEGDVRDALTVLEKGVLVARGNPAAVAFYGQVLLESQQYDRFESWLTKVSEKSHRYPAYWMAMGGWALRKQQPELAARMFGEALLREPGDVATHDRMHQALKAAGDLQAAERFDQRRIELRNMVKMTRFIYGDPNIDPATYVDLAELLDLIGRPLEAKSWRSLAAYKMGQGFQAARQADLALRELLTQDRQAAALATRMCGVDLSRYPIDVAKLMPKQSDEETPTRENSTQPQDAFANTPPASTPVFVNVAGTVGLDFRYVNADPPKERYFLMHEAVGSGIACLDYDLDSAVDLYVGQGACNAPLGRGKLPNLLARNTDGHFVTVTDHARCDDRGYTLGVTSGDWNQDGFPDLVVGNMTRNQLLINQGDGTFRPLESDSSGTGDPLWDNGKYTSSLAIADVTGDHVPDIVEVTYLDDPKIYDPLELGDNGIPLRFPGPLHFQAVSDRVFEGTGDGHFKGTELKTDSPSPGLGLVVTDIDGRSGNDIFVANDLKEPLALLENRTETNHHWVQFQLVGTDCERDAIGAMVTLHVNDGRRVKQRVQTGYGYMSKNQSLLLVGLGNADGIEKIEIRWPDGSDQVVGPIAVDRRWLIAQHASPFEVRQPDR